MSDLNKTITRGSVREEADIDVGLRQHMNSVFGYMATGMLISALVAYGLSLNPSWIYALGGGITRYIVMFAPIIMIFAFGSMMRRLSAGGALVFFYVIAALIGVSFSSIFLVFSLGSIFTTFLTTSVAFGGLALYGYTTKRDLSSMGRFLVMALIGLIFAGLINFFLKSPAIHFAYSVIGVLVFAGFTAYDTQNIKNTFLQYRHTVAPDELKKIAIFGALNLYLDFINLFSFLLNFMGSEE